MVLGFAALAAGGALFASSRTWIHLSAVRPAPFGPVRVDVAGRTEFPALFGLAIVALITVVLVLVTAGWGRRLLGLLLGVVGVSVAWYGIQGFSAPGSARQLQLLHGRSTGISGSRVASEIAVWPALSVACGVLLALAGVAVTVRAGRWGMPLSTRYSAPVEAAQSADPWRSLDRGEDPTIPDASIE